MLVPTGKTVEQVSCLLPQSVLMSDATDNPEIEEMPLLDDPPPPTADPEPVRSQSRRLPARKIIFWSLVVIVVFFSSRVPLRFGCTNRRWLNCRRQLPKAQKRL